MLLHIRGAGYVGGQSRTVEVVTGVAATVPHRGERKGMQRGVTELEIKVGRSEGLCTTSYTGLRNFQFAETFLDLVASRSQPSDD